MLECFVASECRKVLPVSAPAFAQILGCDILFPIICCLLKLYVGRLSELGAF